MGRVLVGLDLVAALALAGCGARAAAVTCAPVENSVAICLNGKPLTAWSEKAKPPHVHEEAGYYAPVADLEAHLGVKAEIAADQKSVMVNGKRVESTASEAKNIHEHDGLVYAPIKEFAEAAGYMVQVDGVKHTVHIRK